MKDAGMVSFASGSSAIGASVEPRERAHAATTITRMQANPNRGRFMKARGGIREGRAMSGVRFRLAAAARPR
jgi:hypothetical protein